MNNIESVNEDTLQCFFFPQSQHINSIPLLCENINKFIATKTQNYIWHREEFKVYSPLTYQTINDFPVHLTSNTCFGDNIEDEWFIVHIILELTKEFPDVIVHLKDSDGDFLLIESANHLPSWVNPDVTENRVFIYQGNIHLIPPTIASIDDTLTMREAVQYVTQYVEQTQASKEVQESILSRIGNYPDKIFENIHYAVAELPVSIAAILQLQPNLIAPIVDAYCHHDTLDVQTFKKVKLTDTVGVKLKFTKCLYAMLLHSKLPRSISPCVGNDKKKILGMKIACGHHMLSNKSTDIYSSKEYQLFLKSLVKNGYFKENIEGSKEHTKLLDQAKTYFATVECNKTSTIVSNIISQTMNTEQYENTKQTLRETSNSSDTELIGDSEDWLSIQPEQLNNLLNSRFGKTSQFKTSEDITPQSITNKLSTFLKDTSDFEGIQLNENEPSNNTIDFEPNDFVDSLQKMMNLLSGGPQDDDNDSDFENGFSSCSEEENDIDMEIQRQLKGRENIFDNKTILTNIVKSMKEEQASSGPSSNLLRSVGMNKTDFIDSDDDIGYK